MELISGKTPGGKLARALLWASGMVAGVFFLMAAHRRHRIHAIENDWRRHCREMEREKSLHDAIIGHTRHAVAAVFGPPRTWLTARPASPQPAQAAYWSATVWYYAIDAGSRSAMAVRFDDDLAAQVDFVHVPAEARGTLRSP